MCTVCYLRAFDVMRVVVHDVLRRNCFSAHAHDALMYSTSILNVCGPYCILKNCWFTDLLLLFLPFFPQTYQIILIIIIN